MLIASWNVNSAKARQEAHLARQEASAIRVQRRHRGNSTRHLLRQAHMTVEEHRAAKTIEAVCRGRTVRKREAAKVATKQAAAAETS